MTIDALETTVGSEDAGTRILLSADGSGGWTLSGRGNSGRRFSDFDAALESARQTPESTTAAIEIWQGGEYICCLPPQVRTSGGGSIHAGPAGSDGRLFTAAERYANRAAQVLMTFGGMLFWLALLIVALAASLGWRLALL